MAGLDPSEEMTDEQLEAASGGELLLQEGGYYAQIRNARRNAARLKEALISNRVIAPLVFLMAQQRDAILHLDKPERHVKIAGRLYDQVRVIPASHYKERERMSRPLSEKFWRRWRSSNQPSYPTSPPPPLLLRCFLRVAKKKTP